MPSLREAATQALEALESACHGYVTGGLPEVQQAITALKAALADPDYWEEEARRYAQNAEYWRARCVSCGGALPATGQDDRTGECVCGEPTALNTVHRTDGPCYVAEPVQEPPEFPPHDDKVHAGAIYWYVGTDGKYYSSNEVKLFMETKNKSLHYEPPKWVLDNFDLIPLYTAPPQRKPLTDEEIKACEKQAMVNGALPFEQRVFFARAIERKHGIGVDE